MEDPDESLFVFFPDAERQSGEIKKVGVKPIHKCCSQMKDNSVNKAILVVEVNLCRDFSSTTKTTDVRLLHRLASLLLLDKP